MDASHEEYSLYHQQLLLTESHLDSILADTTSALKLLSELSNSFKAVEAQTSDFRGSCEGLLAETKRIGTLADEVSENVGYYAYLEPITRRLNAPGAGNFVRSKEFSDMLVNLDNCLDYMQAHVGLTPYKRCIVLTLCLSQPIEKLQLTVLAIVSYLLVLLHSFAFILQILYVKSRPM